MGVEIKDLQAVAAAEAADIIAIQRSGITKRSTLEQVSDLVIARLTASAPEALDAWLELVAQIEDNEDGIAALVSSIDLKAPLASPALTGAPSAPTASPGTDTTQIATTGFVTEAVGAAGWREVTSGTISAAASLEIDLSSYIADGFSKFELNLYDIAPAVDGAYLQLELSNDAGSSYASSNYVSPGQTSTTGSVSGLYGTTQPSFAITDLTGNAAGEIATAFVKLMINATRTHMTVEGSHVMTTGAFRRTALTGWLTQTGTNAIRVRQNSGNMVSGSYELYALR